MAKVLAGGLSRLSGSAGDYTFRRLNGETIMSAKRGASSVKPSDAQIRRQIKWANMVNFARVLHDAGIDRIAFPYLPTNKSWLNHFISMNANRGTAVLTKEDAGLKLAVPDNFQLSEGQLENPWAYMMEPVSGYAEGEDITMILSYNAQTAAPSTIGNLSRALLATHDGLENGDLLTFGFIACAKTPVFAGKYPKIQVLKYQFKIDNTSTETLPSYLTATTTAATFTFNGPRGWGEVEMDVASPIFCFVGRGSDMVNDVILNVPADNVMYAYFTDEDYIKEAIASYGGAKQKPYLQPNLASAVENDQLAIDSNHEKSPTEAKKAVRKK